MDVSIAGTAESVFAALTGGGHGWLLLYVTVLWALLAAARPGERVPATHTVATWVASLLALAASGVLAHLGWEQVAGVVREAAVVLGGVAVIRLTGLVAFRVVLPALGPAPPRILEDLIVILAYLAWGLVRLRLAGLDLSGIVATSAVITAVVAFALQDTLGNVLGGLALELDSEWGIGDWVRVDDVIGRVVDIRWRSTSIETRNWETVVIPNAHLVRSRVTVLGRRQGQPVEWRRWVWFNVGLGAPPARVIEAVEVAVREARIDAVAREPAPHCVLMDFENGYARYALRYWLTDIARDDPTDSAVREHVLAALQRAGIRLAVAERSVHVITEDQAHAQAVHARELARRLAALRGVALFAGLTEDELRALAEGLVAAPFAAGDVVTHQGAVAHWLYILVSGEAAVTVARPGIEPTEVARLAAPTFFGEMGLMTGEPRRATVRALSALECYRLEKSTFQGVLERRPALAADMSHVLAERMMGMDRALLALDAEAARARVGRRSDEILESIKRFFGIAAS